MLQSLQNTVSEPSGTKSAIRQALMSPAGLRVVWVVVEAEEDVAGSRVGQTVIAYMGARIR